MLQFFIFILVFLSGCSDNTLVKHTIEEKYIYPSYYDVYVDEEEVYIEVPDTAVDPIWVDSFEQPQTTDGVDIIWVIDPSGSMNDDKPRVLAGIEAMMNSLPMNISWRLVIISGDPAISVNSSDYPLLPGDSASDAQLLYQNAIWGYWEAGFDAVYEYVNNNPFSSSWMRHEAALLVVFVSDEEEQSATMSTVGDFTNWYSSIRQSTFLATINHLEPSESECNTNVGYVGQRYMDAVNHFNGQIIDICSEDWSAGVNDAANQVHPYSSYVLTYQPLDPSDIYIFTDGVPFSYWTYDPNNNEINFTIVPAEGSLVEIAYYY